MWHALARTNPCPLLTDATGSDTLQSIMTPKKKGPGRPEKEISDQQREQIRLLAGFGLKLEQIALVMDISESTLHRRCQPDIDKGLQQGITQVTRSLFQSAISGNLGAQCFYLKCRAGWREVNTVELSGPGGKPVAVAGPDLSFLSKADLLNLAAKTKE